MKKLIAIDPGHGLNTAGKRTPIFPDGSIMKEREFNKAVADYLKPLLEKSGFDVLNVAESDTDVPLATRTSLANNTLKNKYNRPADYYISVHANASGDGNTFNNAVGVDTFIYKGIATGSTTEKWGALIHKELVAASGRRDRGLNREDFHVIRETSMPASLVECGFMTNLEEAKLLISDEYRRKIAGALATGICNIFGVKEEAPVVPKGTPIFCKPTSAIEKMVQWAKNKGAKPFFVELASTFYKVASNAGIDPTVVYCQSAKETGYGKFGGVLDESYCNPCGMKNSQGGGDYDPNAHKRFASWEEGIQAQVDHLALYAGASGYPKAQTPDPRHFPYLLGTAKTVEALGGKWAPSATYGEDIVKMMNEVINTKVETPIDVPSSWAKPAWDWAKANGITDGTRPQDKATREEVVTLIYNVLNKK